MTVGPDPEYPYPEINRFDWPPRPWKTTAEELAEDEEMCACHAE